MIEHSKEIKNVTLAISKVQDDMPELSKETEAYKYKYCPLEVIQRALNPLIKENGLLMLDTPVGANQFCSRIIHLDSGEWYQNTVDMTLKELTPQGFGSAMTYYRRYNRVALFDIVLVGEDDDGAKASGNEKKATAPIKEVKPVSTDADNRAKTISYLYTKLKINSNKMKTASKEEQAKLYQPVKDYINDHSGISYEDFMKAKGTTLDMAISNIKGGE